MYSVNMESLLNGNVDKNDFLEFLRNNVKLGVSYTFDALFSSDDFEDLCFTQCLSFNKIDYLAYYKVFFSFLSKFDDIKGQNYPGKNVMISIYIYTNVK